MTTLSEARHMALSFISKAGSDCVGVVDTEEKFAAAILYDQMRRDGLLIATLSEEGPVYRITEAGRRALQDGGKTDG